ncbi:MAG: hypothetical protein M1816_006945 [Peltula sp. TS41687]|nr:MAG: hypothetical protein M1816_006945 [Peltula sp. TS41687]
MSIKSLLTKTASLFNKPPTSNDTTCTTLFPPVDPLIDGPGCDQACSTCTLEYPKSFSIDEDDPLYGQVTGWATHVLVATGKTDWTRDVEDEKGSLTEALVKKVKVGPENGRMMLSASNMPLPHLKESIVGNGTATGEGGHGRRHKDDAPTTVLILPSFTVVTNVRPSDARFLISQFINPSPTTSTPLSPPCPVPAPNPTAEPTLTINHLTSHPSPHAYLILLCSQATRDKRCGISAPLLRREFERQLRPPGLYRALDDERPGGVGIYFISHVGGHKYAANVMVYRKEQGQAIWLARVRPSDCEGIVRFTVLQGKVVRPEWHLRGGFDRGRELVSW